VLIASVALAGFVLPRHAYVARRIVIDAGPEHIWPDIGSLATWPEWTEWNTKNDPQYDPKPVGTAKLTWTKSEAGPGEQNITESDPVKGMKYKLELQGGKFAVEGRVQFTKDGTKTAVTWIDSMSFAHSYTGRYFGALMDRMLGPMVEKSLLALKQRSEERARGGGVALAAPPAVVKPEEPKVPGEPSVKPVEPEPPPASEFKPPPDERPEPEAVKPPPAEVRPPPETAKPVEKQPETAKPPPEPEAARPVEAKPAEEKPAEAAKPVDPPPAEEKPAEPKPEGQ
jgi:hypothetical protein